MATALTGRVSAADAPALPFSSPFRFQRESHDILEFFTRWAELGGVARFHSRLFQAYLITAPEAVQHVLQDNHRNYVKELRSKQIFRIALGDGLFLSDGEQWRRQRRIAQPGFHRQKLAAMAEAMADAVDAMILRWESFAAAGKEVDVSGETSRLALDVIGRTLVSQDLMDQADTMARSMAAMFNYFKYALNSLFPIPRFIPTARNRAMTKALREADGLVEHLPQPSPGVSIRRR